jgi:DNA-binding PadR family transcriptional regulator
MVVEKMPTCIMRNAQTRDRDTDIRLSFLLLGVDRGGCLTRPGKPNLIITREDSQVTGQTGPAWGPSDESGGSREASELDTSASHAAASKPAASRGPKTGPAQARTPKTSARPAPRTGAAAERALAPVPDTSSRRKSPSVLSAEAIDAELEKLKVSSKVRKRQLKELRKAGALLGDVLARGFLTAYLLHLCDEHPRHGNEILHEIEARTDNLWSPSSGGVYTVLRKLEKRGLLEGSWEAGVTRERRVYKVTDAGRDALDEFRRLAPPRIAAASRVLEVVAKDLLEG